jgi:ribokinase
VRRDPRRPTGAAVIQVDREGRKQIFAAHGANLGCSPEDVQGAVDTISRAGVLLMQYEIPMETVLAASRIAHRAGMRIVVDPAPAQPTPDELLRRLAVIRPNASEAESLTGIHVTDRSSAREAARALMARGAGAAAVQAGEEGDLLVWPEGECLFERIDVESVDATGAGDAFAAALAVGLAEGMSWEDAGALANVCAALTTTVLGAQPGLPDRAAANELLRRTRGGRRS